MNYGPSNYYPMNNYYDFNPATTMGSTAPQYQAGFPNDMISGPTYAMPVVPLGTGEEVLAGVVEESFIENILRFNKGKIGTFYFTYRGNNKWNSMVYYGRVETAGRDHIIISDPISGKRFLLMMANLDWVEFEEEINYPHTEITPAVQAALDTTG